MLTSAFLFTGFGFLVSKETGRGQAFYIVALLAAMFGIWALSEASFWTLSGCIASFFVFVQLGFFLGCLSKGNAVTYLLKRTFRMI